MFKSVSDITSENIKNKAFTFGYWRLILKFLKMQS